MKHLSNAGRNAFCFFQFTRGPKTRASERESFPSHEKTETATKRKRKANQSQKILLLGFERKEGEKGVGMEKAWGVLQSWKQETKVEVDFGGVQQITAELKKNQ